MTSESRVTKDCTMFQTYLTKLAAMLRGVHPRRNLVFEEAQPIILTHGLQLIRMVMVGSFLWLSWIFFFHTPTLFGQAVALTFLVSGLISAIPVVLSLLRPTATVEPGGVLLARMPMVALRPRRLPCGDFSLGLRPYLWSRSAGRGHQRRTRTAFGWALTLERPWMVPVVLEMRWHGTEADDLPDDAAAQARAEELARSLGLRRVIDSAG